MTGSKPRRQARNPKDRLLSRKIGSYLEGEVEPNHGSGKQGHARQDSEPEQQTAADQIPVVAHADRSNTEEGEEEQGQLPAPVRGELLRGRRSLSSFEIGACEASGS